MRLHTFGGLWLALDDGAPATGLSQPRRLTLLAMVATGGTQGLSRDRVLATLWPESDTERARHALAQLVYSLRRSSGGQPLLAGDSQLNHWIGYGLIVVGLLDGFFMPIVLARKWSSRAR